jgi:segregation and condensation protein A
VSTASDPKPELDPNAYNVLLPQFEGPLDLLLHLIQSHQLNVLDIPMHFITEKYLQYLTVMRSLSIDMASEYLVMAAVLTHIKSKMLLPQAPPDQADGLSDEEELDPREELVRRLLEYQKYKYAAAELQDRGTLGQDVFLRPPAPVEEKPEQGPLAPVPVFQLLDAFTKLLEKRKVKVSHEVTFDRLTITDRINELTLILEKRRRIGFEDLFEGLVNKFDLVITFLALLEMTKMRMTRLFQADARSPMYVEYTLVAGDADANPFQSDEEWPPKPPSPPPAESTSEPMKPSEEPTAEIPPVGASEDEPAASERRTNPPEEEEEPVTEMIDEPSVASIEDAASPPAAIDASAGGEAFAARAPSKDTETTPPSEEPHTSPIFEDEVWADGTGSSAEAPSTPVEPPTEEPRTADPITAEASTDHPASVPVTDPVRQAEDLDDDDDPPTLDRDAVLPEPRDDGRAVQRVPSGGKLAGPEPMGTEKDVVPEERETLLSPAQRATLPSAEARDTLPKQPPVDAPVWGEGDEEHVASPPVEPRGNAPGAPKERPPVGEDVPFGDRPTLDAPAGHEPAKGPGPRGEGEEGS